jgi:hypothetical protein
LKLARSRERENKEQTVGKGKYRGMRRAQEQEGRGEERDITR